MHFPSSPSSEEDAGTISLLLDTGTVSLLLDAGKTLELETSPELDSGVSLDAGTSVVADEEVARETSSELEDWTSAELELDSFLAELDTSELSLEGVSAALADEESSPQATRNAVKSAHKKTSERNLIQNNIKKIPNQVEDDILRLISVDLTSLGALRAQDLAGIKCEPTSGLPLDTLTSLCASRKTRRLGHAGKQACRRDSRLTSLLQV